MSIFGDELVSFAVHKQVFNKLKLMRLVIFEDALGSRVKAEALERELENLLKRKEEELMANKNKSSKKDKKAKTKKDQSGNKGKKK